MSRYKVLMISYSDINSGNATRILSLAKNLSERFDIDIIFDGSENNYIPEHYKSLRIMFTPCIIRKYLIMRYLNFFIGIIWKIFRCLRKYDIVHIFKPLPTSFIPGFIIAKLMGGELILDFDDWEKRDGLGFRLPFLDNFIDFSLRKADKVIVVTENLKKEALKLNKKVYLIPNGADVEVFKPEETKSQNLIVFVGILFKTCDLDIVLKSMKYVERGKLLVVGDGPRRKEFEVLVSKIGIKGRVEFVGWVNRNEIPRYINLADVVVLPMKNTLNNRMRSPIKLGEYMSSGKAIVANDIGIAKEVIKNDYNGLLASNIKRFGLAINRLLKDEKLRKRLEKNARKTAEKYLDWRKISKELEIIYGE